MRYSSTLTRFAGLFGIILLAACRPDASAPTTAARLDPAHALALEVDMRTGTVHQVGPSAIGGNGGARFALLGQNELAAIVTNVRRTTVSSGLLRARVTFDLALTNRLANVDFVPSTFPSAPTGAVVAFPFSVTPSGLFGLRVRPNEEWDGDSWIFYNDDVCLPIGAPSDCSRWEPFGSSIRAGATTPARGVGFDVDASISSFTVYVAIAADLRDRALAPAIALSESYAQFTAQFGGNSPAPRVVQVTNSGGGSLTGLVAAVTYPVGQPTGWLSAVLGGTTAPASLTLTPTLGGLAPGAYLATVTVTSPVAANTPVSLPVTLLVAVPQFTVSPIVVPTLTAGYLGMPAPEQQLAVASTGAVPVTGLTASIEYVSATGWLTAVLDNTTTPTTLRLTATPGTLQPGQYLAGVTVSTPTAGSVSRVVTFNVLPLPDLHFTGGATVGASSTTVSATGLTVVNTGFAAAGAFNVVVCLSTTSAVSGCHAEGDYRATGLAVGGTLVLPRLDIDLAAFQVGPGVYYVFAVVDPPYTANVLESDETNNVLALGTITVPASLFDRSSSVNIARRVRVARPR